MTDFTYEKLAGQAPVSAPTADRKGFWRRVFDAMVEARMRQAERLVADYKELAKR